MEDFFIRPICHFARYYTHVPILYQGQTKIQPVYAPDVARAVLGAITYYESLGETYELTGPNVMTYEELIPRVLYHLRFRNVKTLNLSENFARFYGKLVSGNRPLANPSPFMRKYMPYTPFIGAWLDKLRFQFLFHEDLVDQLKINLVQTVNHPTLKSIQHLGVTPTNLEDQLELITTPWRMHAEEFENRFDDYRQSATRSIH